MISRPVLYKRASDVGMWVYFRALLSAATARPRPHKRHAT
jgi:hypothetical protein